MTDTPAQTEQERVYSIDELQHYVVAACLVDSDLLEQVVVKYSTRLRGELASLFSAASAYYNVARGCLTRQALASILQQNEPDVSKHDRYLSLFDSLTQPPYSTPDEAERRWFLHQFDLAWQQAWTGQVLARAAESMRDGFSNNGKNMTGAEAAWTVIAQARLEFDQLTSGGTLHDAEITGSTDQALLDYMTAKQAEYRGVPLSMPDAMAVLSGIRAGELYLVTAYAHEGKSFLMLNDGYEAWRKGHNVAVATGEMDYTDYRNRMVALHSCDPKFPHPLETTKIDSGELDEDDEKLYKEVLRDIATNPEYGKFFVFKFPRRATPDMIFNKFAAYDQIVPLDFGIIDYLGLMGSTRPRVNRREELDDLLRDVKGHAMDFGDGRGLSVEAGYQVNRTSYHEALREGFYTLACFAESSEAEKSADKAIWLLRVPQNPDEIKMGVLKNRNGELGEHFYARENFRHGQIASLKRSVADPQTTQTASAALLDM
jgi:replicative DNA helicase